MKKSSMMIFAAAGFLAAGALAQPTLVPGQTGPELACSMDTSATARLDTLAGVPDSNGFYTIFNGRDFTGWFQNCASSHSTDKTNGAIWRVDSARHAIYAMSRNGSGGLLSTKKRYAHYEMMFEWWPQYGNDGGVFNRYAFYNGGVASNQMVLDYLGTSGILSYYSEAGFPGGRNGRPWSYNSATTIVIPGSGGTDGSQGAADLNNWSNQTKRQNLITGYGPADIGCSATTGCVQADYLRLWNRSGWMQVRQIYYGGLSTTQPATVSQPGDKIHEFTFFRMHYPLTDTGAVFRQQMLNDTAKWVTVVQDSMRLSSSQVGTFQKIAPFAFQIHGGSRYIYASNGGKGSWYRDIKVRELDSLGRPTYIATSIKANRTVTYDLAVRDGFLVGSMDLDHIVTVTDLKGRLVQEYSAFAGHGIKRALPEHHGVMLVRVKSARGTQTFRYDGVAR